MNTKDKIDFCFDVIKRHDHYVATTNFKVALLMSFLTLVISGVAIKIVSLPLPKILSSLHYLSVAFGILTILSSLMAIIQLLRVVFPRLDTKSTEDSLIFFGDISKLKNSENTYYKRIKECNEDEVLEDLSQQIEIVAQITTEKFRILSLATMIILFLVSPLLLISVILLSINTSL
ncbi:MAG: hypothetical protein KJ914_13210 [Gammaproteobacteria bacterium]|nr:hypothetical protein [Gammaproteobacteria bacterium]MBU1725395.1 hypothetical protein [Gammaproteobacteria bacterium]MBU2005265.1 hypothetical protein [Gammaproteobacteria bacterium]